jgi:hypothetical protein
VKNKKNKDFLIKCSVLGMIYAIEHIFCFFEPIGRGIYIIYKVGRMG